MQGNESIFNDVFGNIAGARAAASLSKEERWDMISKGYNPMVEEDIQAYRSGQRPVYGNADLSKKMGSNLGMSRASERDYAAIDKQLTTGEYDDNPIASKDEFTSSVSRQMESTSQSRQSNLTESLNQRLMSKLGSSSEPQQSNLVQDAATAKKLGYALAKRYIQAFKEHYQSKTSQSQQKLNKEKQILTEGERKVHASVLKSYRDGVAQAENEA